MVFHILRQPYDVMLVQGYDTISSWLVFFVSKLKGIKVIWRGEAVERPNALKGSLRTALKKALLPWYFRLCDAVLYSCTNNKEYLKQFAVPEAKLFAAPCAVDNAFFRKERQKLLGKESEIRQSLGIGEDEFVVLFVGRLTSRKRLSDLFPAITKSNCQKVTVLLVGNGTEKELLRQQAESHQVKLVFTGFLGQKEIPKYYSIADLFVILSEYDASPKVLNEALNFALPVLATRTVGTARDLVRDGENGFIVTAGDVVAISEKIAFFVEDKERARKMGEVSLVIVEEWTFEQAYEGLVRAVYSVLGEKTIVRSGALSAKRDEKISQAHVPTAKV